MTWNLRKILPLRVCTSPQHLHTNASQDEGLNEEERAVICWVVAFTCIFETLHSVSSRAMGWLLWFLGSLLQFLGHYSQEIAKVARLFPCTLHQRSKYLIKTSSLPSLHQYVVCRDCLSIYDYETCLEKRSSMYFIKMCLQCQSEKKNVPPLKEVISRAGNKVISMPCVSIHVSRFLFKMLTFTSKVL